MSRFRRFAHSFASGSVLLGVNTLYTMASVPLAWSYLNKDEYGLWTTTMAIGGYIALVDFGMGASVARILIDHKDDRSGGSYGGVIQTGILVGLVQGVLILLAGTVLAFALAPLLRLKPQLQNDFTWLMIGQCALLALSFAGRIFLYLLTAHQRYDISNYASATFFAANYAVMWLLFARGLGVFSILWAQALGTVLSVGINAWGCLRLKLLPCRGEWGRPTRPLFNELFTFGRDIFLYALGGQLINTSQTILLTRFLGLDAAAVWNVCTRVYMLLLQMIYRVFDYSSAALAEMMARGEKSLLASRFKQIVIFSTSLSVAAGTVFALCNTAFVEVWTSGKVNSPLLGTNNLQQLPALALKLQDAGNPVSRWLWPQLSEPLRHDLAALVPGAPPGSPAGVRLVEELNRILTNGAMYQIERFAGVNLSPRTQHALTQPQTGVAQLRLNRELLDRAYPGEIASQERVRWRPINDLLLAVWLVLCVSVHAHTGLVGQTKLMGFLRYLYLFEGLAFVSLTLLLRAWPGMTTMLVLSIICCCCFSLPYGLRRTRRYFGLPWRDLGDWHRGPLQLALWLAPAATAIWFLTRDLPEVRRLILNASTVGLLAIWVFLRHGLGEYLQGRLLQSSPKWLRALFARIGVPSPKTEAKRV